MLPTIGASHISVLEALSVSTDGGLMVRRGVRSVSKLATGVTSDGGGENPTCQALC
jgi:hypothetical protein